MPQADVILKGLEPYGAVALVALGFAAALLLYGLKRLQVKRELGLARITARKERRIAQDMRKGSP